MIVVPIALFGVATVFAQEQEGKLIDRVLRPNMSLANSAQKKQFAARSRFVDKHIRAGAFCISEKSPTRPFGYARVLSPREFATRHFRTGDSTANLTTRSQLNNADTVQVASAAYGARVAPEGGSNIAAGQFPDNRPFLGQGKSQKALHAHDRPLTIEQVRELLNKNQ